MFRKKLLDLLLHRPMSVTQVSRMVGEKPKDVADDLAHLLRSLKHTDFKAVVDPATCRACGFAFSDDKLTKPSKCPQCQSQWLTEPKVWIEEKKRDA
jgi:predicted Zn-ribbon and HTH transcriptional regulator